MKVRIGRSRSRADSKRLARSPLELALGPAFSEGEWDVPSRFNFTRDVVEVLARDSKRRALTHLSHDGVIEPRTFHQIAENAARWAGLFRERGVAAEDRLVIVTGTTPDWIEVMLAGIKIGAVTIPCSEWISATDLEARLHSSDATLVVASRRAERTIASLDSPPNVVYTDERPGRASDPLPNVPSEDTSSRDPAFILSTAGTVRAPLGVVHTHGATFAARVQTEHWLDAGPGDAVWCTADSGNALAVWNTLLGPWSRGAEVVLHDGPFDPDERLDLIDRLGATILCQTPAEYAALTELRAFRRYRPRRLRRLVSTGDTLARDVIATYEEVWGMTIHEGYGQAETAVVVANGIDAGFRSGSVGLPIAGHEVAVIDDAGNVLGPEVDGELAVHGRPPSLFSHYWGAPEETKAAFRGEWFVTGDVATTDEDGFIRLIGRADDIITSRGRRFGPFEIEHALREHEAVVDSAAVGIRDLERGGQFVRAFVVLRAGIEASEQLEAALRDFVEASLPEYAVPREIEFLDELPRTASGNIRRAELRERQVAGRPLWESAYAADSEPVVLPAPTPEPEPAPREEPRGFVVEEYFQHAEPVSEPEQEPVWPAEPEPIAYVEPDPEPTASVEPEPGPIAYAEPLSTPPSETPSVEGLLETPPAVDPEPIAYNEPAPEPIAYIEPEPIAPVEPVEPVEPESIPSTPESAQLAEYEALPAAEPAPEAEWTGQIPTEPEASATPEPAAQVEAEPEPFVYEPPAEGLLPASFQPEPAVEAEEPLEPLPDYVVDPNAERSPQMEKDAGSDEEAGKPDLSGLGLRPVDFELDRSEPERSPAPKRPRPEAPPPADKKDRRSRSTGEPGDELDEVDWMGGLSTRLSAYSLAQDEESPETTDDDERDDTD